MRRISSLTSRETRSRPPRCVRDFQAQNRRKPLRCQPITVAGLTITSPSRQFGQKLEIKTQKQRSVGSSRGRDVFRFSTASCWRTAKLSKYDAARARSSQCRSATRRRMSIFRMGGRLSRRSLISEGFCGVRSFGEAHLLQMPVRLGNDCRFVDRFFLISLARIGPRRLHQNRAVADIGPALEEEIFGLPERYGMANVHHHREANHFGRSVEIAEGPAHCRRLWNAPLWPEPNYSDIALLGAGADSARWSQNR